MYSSFVAHYKNKYPQGRVHATEDSLDVFDQDGNHVVAIRKNGAGAWNDESAKLGCRDRHDLSPIPKDARLWKLYKDGSIKPSEEFRSRALVVDELTAHPVGGHGKIPSIEELMKHHFPDQQGGFDHNTEWKTIREKASKQAPVETGLSTQARAAIENASGSAGLGAFFNRGAPAQQQ